MIFYIEENIFYYKKKVQIYILAKNTDKFYMQKNFRYVFNENIDWFYVQKKFQDYI